MHLKNLRFSFSAFSLFPLKYIFFKISNNPVDITFSKLTVETLEQGVNFEHI